MRGAWLNKCHSFDSLTGAAVAMTSAPRSTPPPNRMVPTDQITKASLWTLHLDS